MVNVIYDYQERTKQIETYLNFILILDNISDLGDLSNIKSSKIIVDTNTEIYIESLLTQSNTFKLDSGLLKTLKSNTILLLYNLIEGTVNAVLNEFFSVINAKNLPYSQYKNEVRSLWVKYKHRSFNVREKSDANYIVNAIASMMNEVVSIQPKSVKDSELGTRTIYNYDAYTAEINSNDISGNLDARKIKDIFLLYGLPSISLTCNSMLKVKNKRNSLAHGNETFSQVGATITIQELFRIKQEIKEFLDHLLEATRNYIDKEEFRLPAKPWWRKFLERLA